ncbi:hypothetical protein V2J09_003286 [Rumex salicifolius]
MTKSNVHLRQFNRIRTRQDGVCPRFPLRTLRSALVLVAFEPLRVIPKLLRRRNMAKTSGDALGH